MIGIMRKYSAAQALRSSRPRPSRALAIKALLLFGLFVLPLRAQKLNKVTAFNPATKVAGNGVYTVVVEEFLGQGVGLFAIRTDKLHPLTERFGSVDVLVGGAKSLPGTSYTTIRSYDTKTDYVQSEFAKSDSGYKTVWLDSLFINKNSIKTDYLEALGSTGFRVNYSLPGLPRDDVRAGIRDTMEISQVIDVHGKDFNDSWVEVTTIIKNTSTQRQTIGIRYLWDLAIAGDDGPLLAPMSSGDTTHTEASYTRLNFAYIVAAANDSFKAAPPAYNVFGSVITPPRLQRAPFLPVRVQHVSWPRAFFRAFDYAVTDTMHITDKRDPNAALSGGDNAVQYFWGETPNQALAFWPGQSIQVTQALFACFPGLEPPAVMDWDPPTCEILARNSDSSQSIALAIQDIHSGLRAIRVTGSSNAQVDIPDFEIGTNEPIRVEAKAIDPNQPSSFTFVAKDLCNRVLESAPIIMTLNPALKISEYRAEPGPADRYFYLKNQNVQTITIRLNGRVLTLSHEAPQEAAGRSVFKMAAQSEMILDLASYLKPESNRMTITVAGPSGSRAQVIISNMKIKSSVKAALPYLASLPERFELSQNAPNPFHDATEIRFSLPASEKNEQDVRLEIYNMLGQLVRTVREGKLNAGSYAAKWDGRDEAGRELAEGLYLYRLNAGGKILTKKMLLLR